MEDRRLVVIRAETSSGLSSSGSMGGKIRWTVLARGSATHMAVDSRRASSPGRAEKWRPIPRGAALPRSLTSFIA